MDAINPELSEKYAKLIGFLTLNPGAASALRGKSDTKLGSDEYLRKQAVSFSNGRTKKKPSKPATIPDELVSVILRDYFDVPSKNINEATEHHMLSMGAENLVGDLLERYLASVMEPLGWIWCSGSVIKAVDFIKAPVDENSTWSLLQIKNRDNSENSSSSAIRVGTTIGKWFRTFSKRTGTNWNAFPDLTVKPLVSEEGFKAFATDYLKSLKQ